MPTYEYKCRACGFEEEVMQRITESAITKCPKCGEETFERIVSGGAGVLYKGEGWYVTDYSKKSSGGKDSSAPASTVPSPSPVSTPTTPAPAPTKKAD